jgi:hypothetical protein
MLAPFSAGDKQEALYCRLFFLFLTGKQKNSTFPHSALNFWISLFSRFLYHHGNNTAHCYRLSGQDIEEVKLISFFPFGRRVQYILDKSAIK